MQKLNQFSVFFLALLIFTTAGRAQEQQQQQQQQQGQQQSGDQPSQPIPAYHSPLAGLAGGNDQEQPPTPSQMQPDTRSLAGAQQLGLGMPSTEHSYWVPSATVSSTADSNALNSTGPGGWVAYTSLLGMLDLHRVSTNNDLTLDYAGGGTISSDSSLGNSVIQQVQVGDKITFRRNVVSVFDQMLYIPESGFGYSGIGGPSLPVGGGIGLQNGLLPDENILTARSQRISNTSIFQLDTYLTPRSSLTFMGGYSLLHFFGSESGYLDFDDALFQAGYNYQLNRHDTIAVLYNLSAYRYGGLGESLNDNRFNIAYAKRVTGRLAFQISGGPDLLAVQAPAAGTGTGTGTGGNGGALGNISSGNYLYWSLHTAVTYDLRRAGIGASYDHGVNGGSGVLEGAVGDTVAGSVNRQLTRTVGGGLRFGYSRNKGVNSGTQNYSYWFGGGNIGRPLGRSLNVGVSYEFQTQGSNSQFCIGTTCGESIVRHIFSINLSWRAHPFAF